MQSPLSTPRIIERPRLHQLFQDTLATSHLLLTAPAGYGKSTALRALVAYRPDTHLIQLSAADTDLSRLKTRLKSLLQPHYTILLDDIHLLEAGVEVLAWLKEQFRRAEPRWVLAGRRSPLDLELLLINGQLTHITQRTLAFSQAEAAQLLTAPTAATAWQQRLDGWPLALSLLSRLPSDADLLPTTEAHLFSYLAQTVFVQLPASIRKFMQITAVPLRFSAAMAAELWDGREAAADLLAEVQRRNLYLQTTEQPGFYRYHDLIRDYLLQENRAEEVVIAGKVVDWFLAHDDIDMAVEQAVASRLSQRVATLVADIKLPHFHVGKSYLTYRRWVLTIDEEGLAANPILLLRLGNVLSMMAGYGLEAWDYTKKASRYARAKKDTDTFFKAEINLALLHYREGRFAIARDKITSILANADCEGSPRLFGLRIATLVLGDLAQFSEMPPYFEEAIELAIALGTRNEPLMNRSNRAFFYAIPMGRLREARQELEAVLAHFADSPGWLNQYLIYWCELVASEGDWPALTQTLTELAGTSAQIENIGFFTVLWQQHYQTMLAVVEGDEDEVVDRLTAYEEVAASSPHNLLCAGWLRVWHLRRQRQFARAVEFGERLLAQPNEAAYQKALLALEIDIAQGLKMVMGEEYADIATFSLHKDTMLLLRWRARVQLVRIRALLAIICHGAGILRWRQHWRAVLRAQQRSGYGRILTHRDPDLGIYFWLLGVKENVDFAQAKEALVEIGWVEPLLPMLRGPDDGIRTRTALVLAETGDERGMPALAAALSMETDPATQNVLEKALVHLEQQAPPSLTIQLMGGFSVQRGGEAIGNWSRPVVARLLQYFALNAGIALSKDRILDDLWPEAEPRRAWKNFRTIYSLLRKTLEPYMRPKAPNRYFKIRGETYTFDTHRTAIIDSLEFEQIVLHALAQESTLPQEIADLQSALQNYAPILPQLPYEDWLLRPRQRGQELFIEGCHHLAQVYLSQGNNGEAEVWAKRVLDSAPWLEEAYQTLMRAYARQGKRALALRTYAVVTTNLKAEFDVEPSSLTQWLLEQLQIGKSI